MNAPAIIMMIIALLVLWGGLVTSIVLLNRASDISPDSDQDLEDDALGTT